MNFAESFKSKLFQINENNFESSALELFSYQYHFNPVYKSYADALHRNPANDHSTENIPFLPIDFWKSHTIKTKEWNSDVVFKSSGTTAQNRSISHVQSKAYYEAVFLNIFSLHFGQIKDKEVLALLPSYQSQGDSSLIFMVDRLMSKARIDSSYYLVDDFSLIKQKLEAGSHQKILFGVSYALLDLIERTDINSLNTTIIETGGMKGRRKEMIRTELHHILKEGFKVTTITSEYGMTELMSQAYTSNRDYFQCPPWMKISIRDVNDPFSYLSIGQTGGINIIDLANIDTCAFIETKDLGKLGLNGTFQVLGRFDNSDIRGCNLLYNQ